MENQVSKVQGIPVPSRATRYAVLYTLRPGESVVIVGGLGVEDKAKVKVLTPKEEDEEVDENAPMAPAGKDAKDK